MIKLQVNPNLENDVVSKIILPCRKGKWFIVQCENDKVYSVMKKILSSHLYYGRGVWYQKGVVVVTVGKVEYSNINFDEEVYVG